MIRETLGPMIDVMDGQPRNSVQGFSDYLRLYYDTMLARPEFPRPILKVLALIQGPGRRFIKPLLERGRTRAAHNVAARKADGQIAPTIDPDILRLAFVSLAMTPMLLKNIFEEQMGRGRDAAFPGELAAFNRRLFSAGLAPTATT
jgi:hypothetical protein